MMPLALSLSQILMQMLQFLILLVMLPQIFLLFAEVTSVAAIFAAVGVSEVVMMYLLKKPLL